MLENDANTFGNSRPGLRPPNPSRPSDPSCPTDYRFSFFHFLILLRKDVNGETVLM